MTDVRLYHPRNVPGSTDVETLVEAAAALVRRPDFTPEYRRAVLVDGWRLVKRCLRCGDEYPPSGGYGEPGRDFCTSWCFERAGEVVPWECPHDGPNLCDDCAPGRLAWPYDEEHGS